jgi:GMP synthase (glutamine-hydrolysing)
MKATVLQHVPFETAGLFEPALRELGYEIEICNVPIDGIGNAKDADVLVIMGGPISATDSRRFPFLLLEIDIIRRRLTARKPTLGVCLGAQLISIAAGGSVVQMMKKEIGWSDLALSAAGDQSPLRSLSMPVLHWHGEMFSVPENAALLASTDDCSNQAFSIGSHALALQFHPEVDAIALEQWYVAHISELESAGFSIEALRADGKRLAEGLANAAPEMLRVWLGSD